MTVGVVVAAAGPAAATETPRGPAWTRIAAAEHFDQLGVVMDNASAALDVGLAKGNPRRRLLIRSKGRLGVMVAVHDDLLVASSADNVRDPWLTDERIAPLSATR